jgi:hypothetical protein
VPAIPTAVEAVATAVEAVVRVLSLAIQTGIDAVAARFQAIGQALMSVVVGAGRTPVVAGLDTITLMVQAMLDAVAAVIQAMVDAIAQVAGGGGSGDAQQQCGQNKQVLVSHGNAPHGDDPHGDVLVQAGGAGEETLSAGIG